MLYTPFSNGILVTWGKISSSTSFKSALAGVKIAKIGYVKEKPAMIMSGAGIIAKLSEFKNAKRNGFWMSLNINWHSPIHRIMAEILTDIVKFYPKNGIKTIINFYQFDKYGNNSYLIKFKDGASVRLIKSDEFVILSSNVFSKKKFAALLREKSKNSFIQKFHRGPDDIQYAINPHIHSNIRLMTDVRGQIENRSVPFDVMEGGVRVYFRKFKK